MTVCSGRQRMSWLDGIIDSVDISLSKLWEIVKDSAALYMTTGKSVALTILVSDFQKAVI